MSEIPAVLRKDHGGTWRFPHQNRAAEFLRIRRKSKWKKEISVWESTSEEPIPKR